MIDKIIKLGVTLDSNGKTRTRINCEIDEDEIDMRLVEGFSEHLIANNISDVAKLRDFCNMIISDCSKEQQQEICDHDYEFVGHQLNGGYHCKICDHQKSL